MRIPNEKQLLLTDNSIILRLTGMSIMDPDPKNI